MKTNFLSTTKTIFSSLFISVLLLSCSKNPLMACSVPYQGPSIPDPQNISVILVPTGTFIPDLNCNKIVDAEDIAAAVAAAKMNRGGTNPGGNTPTYSINTGVMVTSVKDINSLNTDANSVPVDISPRDGFVDFSGSLNHPENRNKNYVTVLFKGNFNGVINLNQPIEVVVERSQIDDLSAAGQNAVWAFEMSNAPCGDHSIVKTLDQDGNTAYVFPQGSKGGYYYKLKSRIIL